MAAPAKKPMARRPEPVKKVAPKKTPIKSGVPGVPPSSKKALAKRNK